MPFPLSTMMPPCSNKPARTMKWLLCLLLLACQSWSATAAPKALACSHCREKLLTVGALRQALPEDWLVDAAREPVFGSEVLTIQAGMEHAQTILLVHGLGQNGFTDWLPVMSQLATRYHVLALDLPGFGYSASPRGHYSPRNYARVLDWLLARHAKGKAIVIGHSLGGAVSLRFAIDFPGRLEKLVLIDAAGILHRNAFVKNSARVPIELKKTPDLLKDAAIRLKVFGNATVERTLNLADPTRMLSASDTVRNALLGGSPQTNAALALVDEDFSTGIDQLRIPTWLIWGEEDSVAPLRTGLALSSRLPSSQLVVMPNVGHVPMAPPHTRNFLPILERALEQWPAPSIPAALTEEAQTLPDLHCRKGIDLRYSGRYREVVLDGCRAVLLEKLSAQRLVMRDSIVELRDVYIASDTPGITLEVIHSELFGTVGSVRGERAMRVDKSRLDLAGFVIEGRTSVIEVERASRLISSLSELRLGAMRSAWQESRDMQDGTLGPDPSPGAIPLTP